MGFARKSWLAVGNRSAEEGGAGCATSTDVRVVDRGIEAERRARSAVWRRWGRRERDLGWLSAILAVATNSRLQTNRIDTCGTIFLW